MSYYSSYKPWQETPVPDSWVSAGMWPGLHCIGWSFSSLGRRVFDAANEPGSYFTTSPEGQLLVMPSLGIAVLTYWN